MPVEAALAEFARLHAGGTKQCWNRGLPTLTALAPMGDLRALAARTPDGAVVGCAIYKAAAVPTVAIGSAQPAATLLDLAGTAPAMTALATELARREALVSIRAANSRGPGGPTGPLAWHPVEEPLSLSRMIGKVP